MSSDQIVRDQLLALLIGGNAHMPLVDAVADFPSAHFNTRPPNITYTPWHILEHLRIAQWDILDFIRNPGYATPQWPQDYWPDPAASADQDQWDQTIAAFLSDAQSLRDIVTDPATDLYAPIPHAPDYNIFREIIVVSDHNAYHIGEFAILRQVMGTW